MFSIRIYGDMQYTDIYVYNTLQEWRIQDEGMDSRGVHVNSIAV